MAQKKSAKKSAKTKKPIGKKKAAATQAVTAAMLNKYRKPAERPPKAERMTPAKLASVVSQQIGYKITGPPEIVLELTARHPYDAAGSMTFFEPGRWDCDANLVFMDVIATGPDGETEGSIGYVEFTAPSDDLFIVAVNFSGYQITMTSQTTQGPWGSASAFNATNKTSAAVVTTWQGTAGQKLFFGLTCTGPVIGYLESITFARALDVRR